jgi:tetratricopeptide (TPR) repeat protein
MIHLRALAPVLLCAALGGCAARSARPDIEADAMKKESSPAELLVRGDASAAAGDMTRAEQYFVSALKSGADEGAITRRLLVVCATDQRYPVALDYADTYLRHHPGDTHLRFARASLYAATGDRLHAQEDLERVVSEKPDWPDAHYELATVLRESGASLLAADRHYREYLRLSPEGAYAESARGYLLRTIKVR